MASVDVSKLSAQEVAELACTYASLILYDDGQDITHDKITSLITASGVKVEAYWPKIFAKAVAGKDIAQFFNFGGAAASTTASAPAAGSAPVAKEAPKDDKKGKKEEKKKEEPKPEEEEEVGMGGLFD